MQRLLKTAARRRPTLRWLLTLTGGLEVAAGPSFADAFAATARLSGLGELSLTQRGAATFSRVIAPAKLPDLERIVANWRPDVVVHECTDLAAPIAAAAAGCRR